MQCVYSDKYFNVGLACMQGELQGSALRFFYMFLISRQRAAFMNFFAVDNFFCSELVGFAIMKLFFTTFVL